MSKVTSKLQITVPKAIADEHGIRPGDDLIFDSAQDVIRLVPARAKPGADDVARRLQLFDQATQRQRRRKPAVEEPASRDRGWSREALYDRPRSR
jgi:AbrB family looped-hinge helix DNA binding protein